MGQYIVNVLTAAENDLNEIFLYIAVDLSAPESAHRTTKQIRQAVLGLSNMPKRCPLIDNKRLAEMGYRKLTINNYIAFFTIDEETHTVYVERILYARRDWFHIF